MTVTLPPLSGTFTADRTHSSFRFSLTHMKVSTFTASFDDVEIRLVADEQGVRLAGTVQVESVSIKAPAEFREHVVYGKDFFDAHNHPQITFRSEDIQLNDHGTATVRGEVTIKGITGPFVATGSYQLPVEDPWGSVRAGVEFTATVDRREWGFDWQMPLPGGGEALGYPVRLQAAVELVKEA